MLRKSFNDPLLEISKTIPLNIFKDCSVFSASGKRGFMIKMATIIFNPFENIMEVTCFDARGKSNTSNFETPHNEHELIETLKKHCGDNFIKNQLKIKF